MEKATFTIDDWVTVDGLHDPNETWNGFAVPYFDMDAIKIIQEKMEEKADEETEWENVDIRNGRVHLVSHVLDNENHNINDIEECGTVMFEGEIFYGAGAKSWAWTVLDEN